MLPKTASPHQSKLGIKYPTNRDFPNKNGESWLKGRRRNDGAEGLWRIHNNLYDLTDFVHIHPGGKVWLELTKGTDITEAFESHHISELPEKLLPKFQIREATSPRNYPYTFKETGFYRTLKSNVRQILKTVPKNSSLITNIYTDGSLLLTILLPVLGVKYWSHSLAILSGLFLSCTVIASHNYFHKKDNFRMYYFDLSFLSSRDWRISHVLSHHLYTNTINDMQIFLFEPFFHYMPKKKSQWYKYLCWFYAPIIWVTFYHLPAFQRFSLYFSGEMPFRKDEFIPLVVPLVMYVFGGQPLLTTLFMWQVIILVASTHFAFIGTNASHHHPDIFHDGDTPRSKEDSDWGFHQLDTVMDRHEIKGNHWLVLTNFGDHALHHLFPALDHGTLDYLYPVFERTAKQFGIHLRMASQLDMIKGQFAQLVREVPNPNPPYHKK